MPLGRRNAPQIFVTTHQPYFVDALESRKRSGYWRKGPTDFRPFAGCQSLRSSENLVAEGLPLGGLWYSDYLEFEVVMHIEILTEDSSGQAPA